jgi:hypothetical protein
VGDEFFVAPEDHVARRRPAPEPPQREERSPSTRVAVGAVDAVEERQAELVASRVSSLLSGSAQQASSVGRIRRSAVRGVRRAAAAERVDRIQRSISAPDPRAPVVGPEGGALDAETARQVTGAAGGRSMDAELQDRMQAAFGADLHGVRIHTDSDIAPRLGARAFTYGRDVHFGRGEYRPESREGLRVLSHELAHVVAGEGVVHRLALPAYVTESAGMHKSTPIAGTSSEKIRKGGITRSGILADIPADTLVTYDSTRQSPTYVFVAHGGQSGFVNRSHLLEGQQLANSDFYAVEHRANNYVKVYDAAAGKYFKDVLPLSFAPQLIADLSTILNALTTAESTTKLTVDKKRNVIKNVIHQAALGAPVDAGLWPLAAANLTVVKRRVQDDFDTLARAGLVTWTSILESVQFTGADFHKHGQAPLFLVFRDVISRQTTKLVYKPSDLSVDQALFGKNKPGGPSVAQTLDPSGKYISQYRILPTEDAAHQKYSYMEFVESGAPTTRDELLGVYRSLAANMALSYLVGLEDVHHENVLLLTDRVQVIDMEATTGRFRLDPADLTSGGFDSMLWPKAINEGIKPKLLKAARGRVLTAAPTTATVKARMKTEFRDTLRRSASKNATVTAQADELATMRSRIVPIETAVFYQMIARVKGAGNLRAWRTLVDTDPGLIVQAKGSAGHTDAFIKRVLKSRGTFDALNRGEVPFYSRDLSNKDMFDELGNRINATGCSKIGQGIDTEMKGRQAGLRADQFQTKNANVSNTHVMQMFVTQILNTHIAALNDELLQNIT